MRKNLFLFLHLLKNHSTLWVPEKNTKFWTIEKETFEAKVIFWKLYWILMNRFFNQIIENCMGFIFANVIHKTYMLKKIYLVNI